MTNAQEWLESRFPSRESKAEVKSLLLQKGPSSGYDQPQDLRIGSLDLVGELDLVGFTNLKLLCIIEQTNLNFIKGLEECLNLAKIEINSCGQFNPFVSLSRRIKVLETKTNQLDTYQKSAEYLRETLKTTEKSLEEIKRELEEEQEKVKELEKEKATLGESHSQELKNRTEAYGVVQERNQELTKKLDSANLEVSKLSEWIGKLESVSGDSNAFATLKKELELAQDTIAGLREELSSKRPKSYWWV
jgi:DNA repair exonuclease SbcCD ATPase subunit